MTTLAKPTPDFVAARRAMIDSQLRPSGVNDRAVLERMGSVPRENFVPESALGYCYMDRAVPLGKGAFLPAPVVHGQMLSEARPMPSDRVLVVDAGSGYLPALVEPMVGELETVSVEDAVKPSRKRGEFTLLLIDGAVEKLPASLVKRLADDARVVTGYVRNGVTRLAIGRKAGGEVALQPLAEMGIPRLHAFDVEKGWSF